MNKIYSQWNDNCPQLSSERRDVHLCGRRMRLSTIAYTLTLAQLNASRRLAALFTAIVLCTSSPLIAQTTRQPEGFTEPFKTVIVASPESGVLHTLSAREGDKLNEGDIIAKLDSQVLIASVNTAREKIKSQGKIHGAKANADSKAHHLQQMQGLFEQQHASDKEVKQAQLEFDLAKAHLETATDELHALEMDLKRIEAQLERRIVRAPVTGTVLEIPRQVGEAITATESQVATIVALDQLRVRYFLATERAVKLKRGQIVNVSFPDSHQSTHAVVDFVSPVTDSKSGTVRVELLIKNNERTFRSGLRCLLGNTQTATNKKIITK